MLFSVLSVNATTVVKYNVAGSPVSVTHGANYPISASQYRLRSQRAYNNLGNVRSRYGIAPMGNMRTRTSIPTRIGMPKLAGMQPLPPMTYRTSDYYNTQPQVVTTKVAQPIKPISSSRLNKNYNISAPKQIYKQNGVTYYN